MPRWLMWAPLGLLVLILAGQGFRLGWAVATRSETRAINNVVALYVADSGVAGAQPSDCVARPGQARGIWLVISCKPPASAARLDYFINSFGALEGVSQSDSTSEGPRA